MRALWFFVPMVSAHMIKHEHQNPLGWNAGLKEGPEGVGIHFTTSYAIAAVKYGNGSIEKLSKINADADYINLMSGWAGSRSNSALRRTIDRIKEHPVKPESNEVKILSSFFSNVHAQVEHNLGVAVANMLPVFPPLAALEREAAIDAALIHTDLNWLYVPTGDDKGKHVASETNAAFAGLGYGLCHHAEDMDVCAEEESKMVYEQVLYLSFDNSSFSATAQYMQSVHDQWVNAHVLDVEHGWWNMPVYEKPRAKFLTQISDIILDVFSNMVRPPQKIVLMGDHCTEGDFLHGVKTALFNLFEFDISTLLQASTTLDGTTLAARGAAELATRAGHRRMLTPAKVELNES